MERAIKLDLDSAVFNNVHVDKNSVERRVKEILDNNVVCQRKNYENWLLKAISLIDLTTLSGDDTRSNVTRLCMKAAKPLKDEKYKVKTAAVCVYPNRIEDAYDALKKMNLTKEIQIASVATGFPSGLYPLETRLKEIEYAIKNHATEIDVVIDRSLVLMGNWEKLYTEISKMKQQCSGVTLKVILGAGELGTYENVYKASMIAMMAGADFIKTSTGKETVNATLPIGLVMCRAIRKYYQMTTFKVGLKAAGGIKSSRDAVNWMVLVHAELGTAWLCPKLFRIGASSLLGVLEEDLMHGPQPASTSKLDV